MRSRNQFVDLIDRYQLGQAQRLAIGVSLSVDLQRLNGTLVLAEGRGKFLRVRWTESREWPIPQATAAACRQVAASETTGLHEFARVRRDLSRSIAEAICQLAMLSGAHSRMLLVAGVDEPGIWVDDFDGRQTWQGFCEPEHLGEVSGLTIVDALPSRDLAAGGRGWPITALACWLLFADRNPRVAEFPRLLVQRGDYTELQWLPPSDGLDDELPAVRYLRLFGDAFERDLLAVCGQAGLSPTQRDDVGAQGKVCAELMELWNSFLAGHDLSRQSPAEGPWQQLLQDSRQLIRGGGISVGDVLATLAELLARATRHFVTQQSSRDGWQLVPGGGLPAHGLAMAALNRLLDAPWSEGQAINYHPPSLPAVTAAIMALMHLDQMPVTIPWISGSELPRVLGRLTPGSPANWRRVIMEMGDCRPPAMKLREAI
jgi:1,6-anhydro-N-acetylmuramate kinase